MFLLLAVLFYLSLTDKVLNLILIYAGIPVGSSFTTGIATVTIFDNILQEKDDYGRNASTIHILLAIFSDIGGDRNFFSYL